MRKDRSVGSRIIAGLTEMVESLEHGEALEDRFTVRKVDINLEPREYDAGTVREVRDAIRASQSLFARILGVKVNTVQSWEQGLRKPSRIACRFMDEIRNDPEHWIERMRGVAQAG